MIINRAFLCHSSADKKVVKKAKKYLDQYGIFTWLDEFQVGIGDSIRREIEKGIKSSNFLVLFMSKTALESEWVQREIDAAFMREVESKDTMIIPILLESCEIPVSLKPKRYIDFRNNINDGLNSLVDAITFPKEAVLSTIVGRWLGESGALYLSRIGNLVIGKYDWIDNKAGNIFGHIERNRIKFNWTWDLNQEHGMGIFDLDDTLRKLKGGWWLSSNIIDPDLPLNQLEKDQNFNCWEFEIDNGRALDKKSSSWESILATPLLNETSNPTGVLNIYSKSSNRSINKDESEIAQVFAKHAAEAIKKSLSTKKRKKDRK